MNIVKIIKLAKVIMTVSKVVVNSLEEVFQKDLNQDGKIGGDE